MDLPPREALLDIDWLTRTHASAGLSALVHYVRRGAEVYGGATTAIAEALFNARPYADQIPPRWADTIDLRNGLAHRLLTGSWSPDPDGPQAHARVANSTCILWMFPPERRAEVLAKESLTPCEPPLPHLPALRLVEPLDRAWAAHTGGIWGCEVSEGGTCLASASRDGSVSVWNMDAGTLIARSPDGDRRKQDFEREVRDCAITPDGARVISVQSTGTITVWDVKTMTALAAFDAPPQTTPVPYASPNRWRRVAISPDGARLAVAGSHAVDLWDLETYTRVARLLVGSDPDHRNLAVFFRSNTRLTSVSRGDPAAVVTWDLQSHTAVDRQELTTGGKPLVRAVPTSDGAYLVGASCAETMTWRFGDAVPLASVHHGIAGQALAVSRDGRLVATCNDRRHVDSGGAWPDWEWEQCIRVWSLPDLREMCHWDPSDLGCRDIACALAFTPDGHHLIAAGWDGVLRRIVLPV